MRHYDVVIVGGGHGGAQAAIALRTQGFAGSVAIVGREDEPPYERPPLSKEYLAQEKPFERLYLRPREYWADKQVELLLGRENLSVGKLFLPSLGLDLGEGRLEERTLSLARRPDEVSRRSWVGVGLTGRVQTPANWRSGQEGEVTGNSSTVALSPLQIRSFIFAV